MVNDLNCYVLENYGFAEFPAGALVLDVGCGEGVQMQEVERRGCQSVGIERNWKFIANCRVRGLKALQAIGEQIPLKGKSCDGVICKVVIPYTNEAYVFREIGRVLKPGAVGRLCYHGAGYYLRYLLCPPSWKYCFYGIRTLLNTWLFATTGRRLPSFLGDTLYQSHARLRRYYAECDLRILSETHSPTFLGLSVFIYHSIQKVSD